MKRTERALTEGMMRELATDPAGLEILHLGDCFRLLGPLLSGGSGSWPTARWWSCR